MDNERFIKVVFIDNNINELFVDVNNEYDWEKIMKHKERIAKIETNNWSWDLQTNHVVLFQ